MQRLKAVLGIAALAAGLVVANAGQASADPSAPPSGPPSAPPSAAPSAPALDDSMIVRDTKGDPLKASVVFGPGGLRAQPDEAAAVGPPGPVTPGPHWVGTFQGVTINFMMAYVWLDRGEYYAFGNAMLLMQWDGNLMIYDMSNVARWSTRTYGKPVTQMLFQPDDNLVLYTGGYASAPWSSRTSNRCASNERPVLGFQQDSNLVIYCLSEDADRIYLRSIWATGTQGI